MFSRQIVTSKIYIIKKNNLPREQLNWLPKGKDSTKDIFSIFSMRYFFVEETKTDFIDILKQEFPKFKILELINNLLINYKKLMEENIFILLKIKFINFDHNLKPIFFIYEFKNEKIKINDEDVKDFFDEIMKYTKNEELKKIFQNLSNNYIEELAKLIDRKKSRYLENKEIFENNEL